MKKLKPDHDFLACGLGHSNVLENPGLVYTEVEAVGMRWILAFTLLEFTPPPSACFLCPPLRISLFFFSLASPTTLSDTDLFLYDTSVTGPPWGSCPQRLWCLWTLGALCLPGPTYFRLTSAKISPQPGFPVTLNGSAHHSYIFVSSLFLFNVHSSLLSLPFHSNISYIETAELAAVTLLGICSENPRPYQRDVCSPMFAAALVTVAKNWNQPSCLPTDE